MTPCQLKTGDTRRHCEVELTVCNNLPQPPQKRDVGNQSGIRLHKRVPMVKIWGSSKNDQNRIMGKL